MSGKKCLQKNMKNLFARILMTDTRRNYLINNNNYL